MRRLRILTWHVHGNYLWYLSQARHDFFLPVRPRASGYGGRGETFPFGDNVHEVAAENVRDLDFDCILFQHRRNWEEDQHEILSPRQRRLPRIYLEHEAPQDDPTDARHWVDDPAVLVVHVTHYNQLMWDCGRTATRVIEHGVMVPHDARYRGDIPRGLVVINDLATRGRRLGADIFQRARAEAPLDLVGMNSKALGGLGEIFPPHLAHFTSRYRLLFSPIRHSSLSLAILEAMLVGVPIVGLATTELTTVIESGVSGFIDTNPGSLLGHVKRLLRDPDEARFLGAGARRTAQARFGIERFKRDWEDTFWLLAGDHVPRRGNVTERVQV